MHLRYRQVKILSIYETDQLPSHAYIILKGKVYGFEYSKTGEERIYSLNGPESIILEDTCMFRKASPVGFRKSP